MEFRAISHGNNLDSTTLYTVRTFEELTVKISEFVAGLSLPLVTEYDIPEERGIRETDEECLIWYAEKCATLSCDKCGGTICEYCLTTDDADNVVCGRCK